jgi:four helix bundle protein
MSRQLKDRTKTFSVRVIKMCKEIPSGKIEDIIIKQVVRSATTTAANYRSSLRGRSTADFISKLTIAEEEADETCYWLELMIEVGVFPVTRLEPLLKEATEITAILTASGKTAKSKRK